MQSRRLDQEDRRHTTVASVRAVLVLLLVWCSTAGVAATDVPRAPVTSKWVRSFNPQPSDAHTRWTGVITGYSIHDDRETNRPFSVLTFRRDGESESKEVYLSFPTFVDARPWSCRPTVVLSVYRYEYRICDSLPPAIVLGRTRVGLSIWYEQIPGEALVVASTNAITSLR